MHRDLRSILRLTIIMTVVLAGVHLVAPNTDRASSAQVNITVPARCTGAEFQFPIVDGFIGWLYADPRSTDTTTGKPDGPKMLHTGIDIYPKTKQGNSDHNPANTLVYPLANGELLNIHTGRHSFNVWYPQSGQSGVYTYNGHVDVLTTDGSFVLEDDPNTPGMKRVKNAALEQARDAEGNLRYDADSDGPSGLNDFRVAIYTVVSTSPMGRLQENPIPGGDVHLHLSMRPSDSMEHFSDLTRIDADGEILPNSVAAKDPSSWFNADLVVNHRLPDGRFAPVGDDIAEDKAEAQNPVHDDYREADPETFPPYTQPYSSFCKDVQPNNVDVVLIIDASGSMVFNDPDKQRLAAARTYLTASHAGDFVGVVDFNPTARLLSPLLRLPDNESRLIDAINTIGSNDGTNIGRGIQAGCEALFASAYGNTEKAAILLSDGKDDPAGTYTGQASCFSNRGWPIHTFGFGSADDPFLQRIANDTGGEFKRLPTANLVCEFQAVRAKIAGVNPGPCIVDHINPGETLRRIASIAVGQLQATFSTSWPGSDVVMTLTSPSGGIVIDRNRLPPNVTHDRGATFEIFTVTDPEPGDWLIDLYGADIPAGGEEVVLGVTTLPSREPSVDLEVTHIESDVLTLEYCAGDSVNFTAHIRNNGAAASGDFWIRWIADGQSFDGGHGSIAAGATDTHGHIWQNLSIGEHTLTFVADAHSQIAESNENNNESTMTLLVEQCGTTPTANAGPDQSVPDANGTGHELVTLDGSASSDPDGTIVAWEWSEDGDVWGIVFGSRVNPTVLLDAGQHTITLKVTDNSGAVATDTVDITVTSPTPCAPIPSEVYCAEFFDNMSLSGAPRYFQEVGKTINHDWAYSGPYAPCEFPPEIACDAAELAVDEFSVRWQGRFAFDAGTYIFRARADDGVRVLVDGVPIIDAWFDQGATDYSAQLVLSADEHLVEVQYYEHGGAASVKVWWEPVDTTPPTTTITLSPSANAARWHASDVTVSLSAADNTGGSGVQSITYQVSDDQVGPVTTIPGDTATLTIQKAGLTTLSYFATDQAGNAEPTRYYQFKIDKTAPVASAGADQTVNDADGNGSQAVALNGAASSDTVSSIAGYRWLEGATQRATGATPTVTLSVGTHTLTLEVTDAAGFKATDTVVVTITARTSSGMSVSALTLTSTQATTTSYTLTGKVTIKANGVVVSGATVTAKWTLPNGTTATVSATTNASGVATFTRSVSVKGSYTLAVTNVTRTGMTYNSAGNVITSKSITVGSTTTGGSMSVSSITLTKATTSTGYTLTGRVYIKSNGVVVGGASVTVKWTYPNGTTYTQTATTNASGYATFTRTVSARGAYTLAVTNATKSGYMYNASGNVVTTKSVSVP